MFCSNYHIGNDMVSSKKDIFVLVNWLCSVVVLFTLPHLFSQDQQDPLVGGQCAMMLQGSTPNTTHGAAAAAACSGKDHNFGSLLGFTSVSYLVGYFGVLLAMKEQDRRSRNMKQETGESCFHLPCLLLACYI
jgi:hypothetical protein